MAPEPAAAPKAAARSRPLSRHELRRLGRRRLTLPFLPVAPQQVAAVLPANLPIDTLLGRLAAEPLCIRSDLRGTSNARGGSGGLFGHFVEAGDWFIKANAGKRYDTLAEATAQEQGAEHLRQELEIYHPDRVWFVSCGLDEHLWTCSLTPKLLVLRQLFESSGGDSADAWRHYERALELAFRLALERSVFLDCNPNNFAVDGDRLYYIDDDLVFEPGGVSFVTQALLRLREYGGSSEPLRLRFLNGLAEILLALPRDCLDGWNLIHDLEQEVLWPQSPHLRQPIVDLLAKLAL